MLKIMICRCNITSFSSNNIECFESTDFNECDCHEEHQYFVALCPNCSYNATLFDRKYFHSTNCYGFTEKYHFVCDYCSNLKNTLNRNVFKVCIRKEDLERISFEIMPRKTYLYKKIKASPFFCF